jgi:hypothetical protein
MAKVVIDANVIISAAFGGKPLGSVVRALEDHEVYLSQTIERELQGVISGLSKKLGKEQILFIQETFQQFSNYRRQGPVEHFSGRPQEKWNFMPDCFTPRIFRKSFLRNELIIHKKAGPSKCACLR